MMRASWAFGIGILFMFGALGMLFTENPWGSAPLFCLGAFLILLGFVDTEPLPPRRNERQLERYFDR